MPGMDLSRFSALELAALVRAREVTAREVTEHALAAAERLGPAVGAFTCLAPERALREARVLDDRIRSGQPLPPLVGVPCPIKDLNPVAGLPFEAGSAVLRGNVAETDDAIVAWLRDAGTVMLGKTNTPEFGLPCYTEPDGYPPARTPWDPTRSAGGSSGGAAAAVAAGIVPIAHGSDGGGSIRIPASACGLVGLKASRGRISSGPLREPGPGLATDGVLSRTVRDTAAVLDALAGARSGDTYYAPPPADTFLAACDKHPQNLGVGLLTRPVIAADAPVHHACIEAANSVAALLAAQGHRVDDAPVPFSADRWNAFQALWAVGALSIPVPEESEARLRPLTAWLRRQGRSFSGLDHALAWAAVQRLTRDVAEAWDEFDVIVTPTLAQPPAHIGELRDDEDPAGDFAAQTRFTPWTSVYNLSGRPAISLPLHTAEIAQRRLPIGVMLGGRFGTEGMLLALGAALEEQVGGFDVAPALAG